MFCEEMHFVYEIVDDLIGTKSKHRFLYARSAEDLEELWVPIIEKAFFKHMTCLEMCDGGQSFEVAKLLADTPLFFPPLPSVFDPSPSNH